MFKNTVALIKEGFALQRPVVNVSVAWVAGIMLAMREDWRLIVAAAVVYGAVIALLHWRGQLQAGKWLLLLLVFAASACYYGWFDHRNTTHLPAQSWGHEAETGRAVGLTGFVASPVSLDGDQASFLMKVDQWQDESGQGDISRWQEYVLVKIRLKEQIETETVAGWERGDAVRLQGTIQKPQQARNFGGFDYRRYLRWQHVHWLVTVKGSEGVEVAPANGWTFDKLMVWNDRARNRIGAAMDGIFSADQAGFMKSLIVAIRDTLDPEQYKQYSLIGMTHVLAISGLHVAVFLGGCMWLMRRMRLTRETILLVSLFLIPAYVVLTGASPSVIRAGAMAMLALYAARRNALKDGLHLIGISAVAMLLWNPYYIHDIGFQLSFLVTLGLIMGVQRLNSLLPIRNAALQSAVSVTLTAQLVSFPLTVYYFNQYSLLSTAANFVLVPVLSMIVLPGGMVAFLLSLPHRAVGAWLVWLVEQVNIYVLRVIVWMNDFPGFLMIWPSPPLWWVYLFYIGCVALVWGLIRLRHHKSLWSKLLPVLVSAALAGQLSYGYADNGRPGEGEVDFLDVGQGDAILIRTPDKRFILIDGGGTVSFRKPDEQWRDRRDPYEVGRKVLVPLLKKRGVHAIDYVIATHEDQDHIGGLLAVVEEIPVKRFVFNGTLKSSQGTRKLFEAALKRNIPLLVAESGKTLEVDKDTKLYFLHPGSDDGGDDASIPTADKQNEQSVVCLMRMYESTFLFTGDIGAQEEQVILANEIVRQLPTARIGKGENLGTSGGKVGAYPIDVLKIAHHGSKSSTMEEWLDFWQPKIAVISAGLNNAYGHPSPQTLDKLNRSHAVVFRTDLQGEIQMRVVPHAMHVRVKIS